MKLILKSFLVCVLLLAGYHFVLKALPARLQDGGSVGSQPSRNLMKAQAYYYASSAPEVVVVGSSITERLHDLPKEKGDQWYNFGFPGGSSFTGMELVLQKAKKPKLVLIETNVLTLEVDHQLVSSLTYPVLKDLRNKAPELLEKSQPVHVIARALEPKVKAEQPATPMDPGFFQGLIDRRLKELAKPLPQARLDEIVKQLKGYVGRLQKEGIEVIFFEMPELPASTNAPLKVSIRDRILREFPPTQYKWMPMADAASFQTTDAVHLNPEGATRYSQMLSAFVASRGPAIAPHPSAWVPAIPPTTSPATLPAP